MPIKPRASFNIRSCPWLARDPAHAQRGSSEARALPYTFSWRVHGFETFSTSCFSEIGPYLAKSTHDPPYNATSNPKNESIPAPIATHPQRRVWERFHQRYSPVTTQTRNDTQTRSTMKPQRACMNEPCPYP